MAKLNAVQVRNAKPGRHADGKGLYLLVKPKQNPKDGSIESGAKSWVLRVQVAGRRRDYGLGSLDLVSLEEARDKAREGRKIAKSGLDPSLERKKAMRLIPTFREAAERYHQAVKGSWRNGKHAHQWLSTLEAHAFPLIGSTRVDHIDAPTVQSVLLPIWLTLPETARRVRQRVGSVLDYAHGQGWRETGTPRNAVNSLMKRIKQPRRGSGFAAMPYADLPDFTAVLRASWFLCPACGGALVSDRDAKATAWPGYGFLNCESCAARYPVVDSVPVLIKDLDRYLADYAQQILLWTRDTRKCRTVLESCGVDLDALEGREGPRHFTMDSPEIVCRYLVRQLFRFDDIAEYLSLVGDGIDTAWLAGSWDFKPYSVISDLETGDDIDVVELGCCTGVAVDTRSGVRSLTLLERHFGPAATAASIRENGRIPAIVEQHLASFDHGDFILRRLRLRAGERIFAASHVAVGDVFDPPLPAGRFDLTLSFNLVDVLDAPRDYLGLMADLTRDDGLVATSSPYQWSEKGWQTMKEPYGTLRPRDDLIFDEMVAGSALRPVDRKDGLPWHIWKTARDFETYIVDFLVLRKAAGERKP